MARIAKNLALGSIQSDAIQQIYVVPNGINTTGAVLSFTNTTSNPLVIDIFHNDGSTDFLIKKITLPGGEGIERIYNGFQRRTFNAGHIIKVQANVSFKFNFSLHGSENEI